MVSPLTIWKKEKEGGAAVSAIPPASLVIEKVGV
jgi:hypothetical protein